jgi:hypothetical protein
MITALAIAIPLAACVVFALGVHFGWSAAGHELARLRDERDAWKSSANDALDKFNEVITGQAAS